MKELNLVNTPTSGNPEAQPVPPSPANVEEPAKLGKAIEDMLERKVAPFLARLAEIVLKNEPEHWFSPDDIFTLSESHAIHLTVGSQQMGKDQMEMLLRLFFMIWPGVAYENMEVRGYGRPVADGVMLVIRFSKQPDNIDNQKAA